MENPLGLHGLKISDQGQEILFLIQSDPPEMPKKAPAVFVTSVQVDESLISKFSDFDNLLRTKIWVLTFVARVRTRNREVNCTRNNALNVIYRISQVAWFSTEIDTLKKSAALKSRSPLASLNLFVDQFGVSRVGGRLENSILQH